jgi:hypothetical protein
MNDRDKNLQAYVNDMFAVEKHTLEAVNRQVDHGDIQRHANAHQLVKRIQSTLNQNTSSLERRLDTWGGTSSLKSAAASVAGVVAGAYDHVRSETASRMLRDDYTALSLVAVAYTMLHTTALSLQDNTTADLALQNLKKITPLITDLSKIIPTVVVHDVHHDVESADISVAQQAVRNTQEAWDGDHIRSMSTVNAYAAAD